MIMKLIMDSSTYNTRVKVPIFYNDIVLLGTEGSIDDVPSLKPNPDGRGGGGIDKPSGKSHIITAKRITTFGTWNVRTLNTTGALTILLKELERMKWDVIGLAETHWTGIQEQHIQGYKIISSGGVREHRAGVGIVMSGAAQRALIEL